MDTETLKAKLSKREKNADLNAAAAKAKEDEAKFGEWLEMVYKNVEDTIGTPF